MKLATLRTASGRDGTLIVCSRDLRRAVTASAIAQTLQQALDHWDSLAPGLHALAEALEAGRADGAFALQCEALAAPLPRAHAWIDSSVYLNHMELSRRLRNAEMPEVMRQEPHLSARLPDAFHGPCDDLPLPPGDVGLDLEAELAVVLGDVPAGASTATAGQCIRLVTLVNDVSLRTVYARDLARGKTMYHGKGVPSMAPVAVTPDELGPAWDGNTLALDMECHVNGMLLGRPNAAIDMAFGFPQIIAHAAALRPLGAGTVLGSGTVSNRDRAAGSACIAERRMIETIDLGAPVTPYLREGDHITIEMKDGNGQSVFGRMSHTVRSPA